MKKGFICAVVVAVSYVAVPAPTRAHHGDAGRYIAEAVTLTGTVTQFVLVNPHAYIILDVTENGTTTTWTAEMATPQTLATDFGWTPATTKKWIGNRFTITGRRLKGGAPYINLTDRAKIVMTDTGVEIFKTRNFGQPVPEHEK
jgi:hypothetical protein